jgi:hypothetical protein
MISIIVLVSNMGFSQVQIGTGTSTDKSLPIEPYYGYSYSQQIYLASEIGTSGTITGLKFYFSGSSLSYSNNWTIYIGASSKTSFTGNSDWVSVSSLTQVYSNTFTSPTSSGWIYFDITDWAYNGTDNIIIAVDENSVNYDGIGGDDFYCTSTSANRAIEYHNDNTNPNPSSPPIGTLQNYRSNIIFEGISVSCPSPTNLSAVNVIADSADLSWITGGSSNWNVEYGLAGFSQGSGTYVSTTSNPYRINGLSPQTYYNFYVQDSCGVGDVSVWKGPYTFMSAPATINTLPHYYDFEAADAHWSFESRSQSDAMLMSSGGNPDGVGYFTGGDDMDWFGGSTVVDAFSNTTHVSSATVVVDASSLTSLRFEFDKKQLYDYQTEDNWLRVMINGDTYAKDFNGDSTWNPSTNEIFQTLKFDLSAYAGTIVNISIQNALNHNMVGYEGPEIDETFIDNVKIYEPSANDLMMHAIITPESGFEMTNYTQMEVVVFNNGTATQSAYNVSYSVNDGSSFTSQAVTNSIAPLDYDTIIFNTPADMSTLGHYDVILTVTSTGDAYPENDTIIAPIDNHGLPYYEDFESYNYGDTPNGWGFINNTSSGGDGIASSYGGYSSNFCYMMRNNSAVSGDLIAVLPPVYSNLYDKAIKFWVDGSSSISTSLIVGVLMDRDDAATFVGVDTVTVLGTYSHYIVDFSSYNLGGKYIAFKHGMTSTYKTIYIDNIVLYEPQPNEMMMLSWDAPKSAIDKNSGDVKVSVYNNGLVAQSNIPVKYSVDGGTNIVSETITATINPGDTFQYTFNTSANLVSGINHCGAVVSNGDIVPQNDSVFYEMTNYSMPYSIGFENTDNYEMPNGWSKVVETGTTSSYVKVYYASSYAQSGNKSLKLYNYIATSGNLLAILPEYGGSILSDKWIKFWHKGYSTVDLIVGVMTDPNDATTFVAVDTIRPSDSYYHEYVSVLSNYQGNGKFIAFKHGLNVTYRSLYVDDVKFELAPTTPIFEINPDSVYKFSKVRYSNPDTVNQVFQIRNAGVGNLSITSSSIGGVNASNFSINDTNTYPKILGVNESLGFTVRFFGNSIGDKVADLLINNGLYDTVVLQGEVFDPIISGFPYVENFDDQEVDNGWLLQGEFFNWQYQNYQTPSSSTGPSHDVTGGYYIYTEASNGNTGDVASIVTNPLNMSALSNARLNYWYHMFGSTIDSLSIELAQNGVWNVVDTLIGQQQTSIFDAWLMHSIDLSSYADDPIDSIRFRAVRGLSYTGDIAIDNIAFGENFSVNLGPDINTCTSTSVVLDAGAGNSPRYYKWIDNASGNVIGNSQTLSVTSSGTYIVKVRDDGYFGDADTINVTIGQIPIVKAASDASICLGDSIKVSTGNGLFFSEYIEGSGSNKALELCNASNDTINLNDYSIMTNVNGSAWSGQYHFPVGAKLAPADVFVIAHENANSQILAHTDDTLSSYEGGSVVWFNGDDVRALFHKTSDYDSAMIDIIGLYNLTDPGSGWAVAGVNNATKNHSLVRKCSVLNGDTSWSTIAGSNSSNSQYYVYQQDDFSHLGSHSLHNTSSYTYSWSTGETTTDFMASPSANTDYILTVTNGACQRIDTMSVIVNALPVVSIASFSPLCVDDANLNLTGGTPVNGSYNGNYVNNGVFFTSAAGVGTHLITYSYTNANGCTNIDTASLTVNSLPMVILSGLQTDYCENNINDTLIGSPSGGLYSGAISDSVFSPSTLGVGSYNVVYTYVDANGCSNSDTNLTTVKAIPAVNLGNDTSICIYDSILLDAGANQIAYSWSTGASSQSIFASYSGVGVSSYSVEITANNACQNSDTINVTFEALPVSQLTDTASICGEDLSLTLNAGTNPQYSYLWSTGATSSSILVDTSILGANMAYVSVDITNAFGCVLQDSAFVYFREIPQPYLGNDTIICWEDQIMLNAGVPNASYLWSNGATSQSITLDSLDFVIGNNEFSVQVNNSVNCSNSDTISILVNNCFVSTKPSFTVSQSNFTAPPFIVNFTNTSPADYNDWVWNFGDGTFDYTKNPSHTFMYNGNYDVILFAFDTVNDIMDTAYQTIVCTGGIPNPCSFNVHLTQSQSYATICVGDSVRLSGTPMNNVTYTWLHNGAAIPNTDDSIFYAKSAGFYMLVITSSTCSKLSDNFFVMNNYPSTTPIINMIGSINPCSNDSLKLEASAGFNSYLWNTGATTSDIYTSTSGYYSVEATDNNACKTTSLVATVNASLAQIPNICAVGVDGVNNHNVLHWQAENTLRIDSFRVYKEEVITNEYVLIGSVVYSASPIYEDLNSNVAVQQYKYRISAIDTCGAESPLSMSHKTMHLQVNAAINDHWNLVWQPYEGFNFASYRIYRGTDSLNMSLLATVSSSVTAYTDLNNPIGDIYYQIEIESSSPCQAKSNATSRSNLFNTKDASGVGVNTQNPQIINAMVYPNPSNGLFTLEIKSAELNVFNIQIFNALGASVYQKEIQVAQQYREDIDLRRLAKGVYSLRLIGRQGMVYYAKLIIR